MSDPLFWNKLIRYLNKESLPSEKEDFEKALNSDELKRKKYEDSKSIWESASFDLPQTDPNARFEELKHRITQEQIRSHWKKARQRIMQYTTSIAASLFLLASVTLGIFYPQIFQTKPKQWITKVVPKGQKSQLQLADGTLIWINSDSRVIYPEFFNENERVIRLEGEAFFEVARDTLRPFKVISGEVVTHVLGTSFNVRAYDAKERIEVFVKTGKVSVSLAEDTGKSISLDPNEVATYDFSAKSFEKSSSKNLDKYLSWKDNYVYLNNTTLAEFASTMERRFDLQIRFENKDIKNCLITGKIHQRSFKGIMDIICESLGLEYSVEKRVVTISGKGCQNEK